jgi:glycyl-tRNA synthetase (class II)
MPAMMKLETPYCLTIDHESVEEGALQNTVTLRNRDTTEQVRISISEAVTEIRKRLAQN